MKPRAIFAPDHRQSAACLSISGCAAFAALLEGTVTNLRLAHFAAIAFLLAPMAACGTNATAAAEIKSALTQWMADFNDGKADKVCDLFAPDLVSDFRGQPERTIPTSFAAFCSARSTMAPAPSPTRSTSRRSRLRRPGGGTPGLDLTIDPRRWGRHRDARAGSRHFPKAIRRQLEASHASSPSRTTSALQSFLRRANLLAAAWQPHLASSSMRRAPNSPVT